MKNDEWRDGDRDIIKAFEENGLGRVESFRLIRSPETEEGRRSKLHSRGKGKKRKPWER